MTQKKKVKWNWLQKKHHQSWKNQLCLEGPKDDAPENNVEVDADPSDTQETTPEEVAAGDSTSDLLLTSVTESDSNPTGEVQDAATEILTESLIEAVKFRALR